MPLDDSDSDNEEFNKKSTAKLSKTHTIKVDVTSLIAQKILKEKPTVGTRNNEVLIVNPKRKITLINLETNGGSSINNCCPRR